MTARIEPGSTLSRRYFGNRVWAPTEGGANVHGVAARGVSYGPHFALGGMFLLDFLDQRTARDADNSLSINNSNVFAKWFDSELDAFGSKSRMNVAANTWILGLAIEF